MRDTFAPVRRNRRAGARWVVLVIAATVFTLPSPAFSATVRDYEWHARALQLAAAHRVSTGSGVTVAVLDSGVDASLPDLADRVVTGTGFGADAAPDGRADADTAQAHGSAMAGLIAARGNGSGSVLGVAPGAKIMPISTGIEPTVAEIADGIRWAVDHGAGVINISIGRPGSDVSVNEELSAIKYALDRNVVIIAAAGNSERSGAGVAWPAKVPGVVAVAGLDKSLKAWKGSGHGAEVVVAAPAVQLISPAPKRVATSGFVLSDGTSGASALVAGTAALIRSRYPELDVKNVINRLIATAADAGPAGRDDDYGFGGIAPAAALGTGVAEVSDWPIQPPTLMPEVVARRPDALPRLVDSGGAAAAVVLFAGAVVLFFGAYGLRRRRVATVSGWPEAPPGAETRFPSHGARNRAV
ncbi:MAG: S8 family serine peptidase [Mycobacteriales bacterium]